MNFGAFLETLSVGFQGMFGVFIVMFLIYLSIKVMTNIFDQDKK